ncbi:unnamed protein product [Prunus brigantina]
MSETLTTIFEESSASSSTLENFQEEGAQQLHETYALNNTTIRLGLYSKVKFCNKENTITSDIDSAETKPSKNDPNSNRSFNKSVNFSPFTSFFRPNATSPSTTKSNHDHHDIHDDHNEMLALRERVLLQRILWKSSNWRLILYDGPRI